MHVNEYHFTRFTIVAGAKVEARIAARCALNAGLGKDAVIVLDFEATNLGWSRNAANIKAWIVEIKPYTMGSWTNSMPLNNHGRGGWIANYPSNPSGLKFYTSYRGWQWTSTKHLPRCYGGFDVSQMYSDYYYGTPTKMTKSQKATYY